MPQLEHIDAIERRLWSAADTLRANAGAYTDDDVTARSEAVFAHVFRAYPTVPSPFYDDAAAA